MPDDAESLMPLRWRHRAGRHRRLVLAGVVAALLLAAIGAYVVLRDPAPKPLDQATVTAIAGGVVEKAVTDLQQAPARSARAYQAILPSLVRIEAARPEKGDADATGLGAGVIVNARGAILTANHVIAGATGVRVTFADGTTAAAEVASSDPENDIAVLAPERGPEVIVPAVLGGAGQVGEEAYAIGHPLGYQASLTTGVISGLDRVIEGKDGKRLRGLIQFDAAVNPGNSGGPLLDRDGRVIGIVTALANPSRDGYFIGIGFAVPIGTAGGAAGAPPK